MARYVYNAKMVTEAISKLSESKNSLSDVNGQIQVGISKIAVYLDVELRMAIH